MRRFGEYGAAATWLTFLWRLHRKEPGCVVGEHMHVRFGWWCALLLCLEAAMDRFGETERSKENRTEGAERLTRVGEEER